MTQALSPAPGPPSKEVLRSLWLEAWPKALEAWSRVTALREPDFFDDDRAARSRQLSGEIAAIRLTDHTIGVNLATIRLRHLEDHPLAILAHEIGHHVYVPGNLTDHGRMLAAIGRMLEGTTRSQAPFVANLYSDLLINDRLQRRAGIDMAAVYKALKTDEATAVWSLYTRTCEHLWRLPAGTIAPKEIPEEMDADAQLLARIVRSFAGEWLRGARRFAAVLYKYLAQDLLAQKGQTFTELGLGDTKGAGRPASGEEDASAIPDGLAELDPSEIDDDGEFEDELADPLGTRDKEAPKQADTAPENEATAGKKGQFRQPFEYGALLSSLGLKLPQHEVTARYYKERALPHLIPFPERRQPTGSDPIPEGTAQWEATDPVERLDPIASILRSPVPIAGVTTEQRLWGESPGSEVVRRALDLDIYVDSSGSMPNPAVDVSYLALAASILALSALRAGARVQATLWSGAGQFETTGGFIRDEKQILQTITGFLGDGTAFPLHVLRDTYAARKPDDPAAHVVVISDDGADTMLQSDDKATPGDKVCRGALEKARGGGTLVLNLFQDNWRPEKTLTALGFRLHRVTKWEELVRFAREFVRENYVDRKDRP